MRVQFKKFPRCVSNCLIGDESMVEQVSYAIWKLVYYREKNVSAALKISLHNCVHGKGFFLFIRLFSFHHPCIVFYLPYSYKHY